LRRIFGPKVEEIILECGKLQNENLYVRRIHGSEYVACIWEMRKDAIF
jgi:hypothetical protein